ncbi:helix-hairpin-helix domain-containing protein [Mucilaginibacter psychrotolerans]|uniref:Pathogenicity locus n=1 Tax=Mucilaginibacter psychrotolerans TaxID=1524096 RepID=A0A4Y8S9G8_9SPHI|nr:helix-hairpin-helix domain-containing protein [Mucilaginibacter psychrotolerans]TFF35733.1 Pathogenicity locus [Mucilaginibacter psychrotolerans]
MKKNINYRLTETEKQTLKAQKISQKMLQDHAPDEVAVLLNASPHRAKELQALAEFQSIPSLGINFAEELIGQGYYSLAQLKGKDAVELFDAFENHCGTWADPCVEDSYRLLVHYIETRDDSKRWWHFTAERKAYREQHGFAANRPQKPWYEDEKYPKMNAYKRD